MHQLVKKWEWYWLEEIFFAVDASCSGETFVRQQRLTVGALETLWVPVSVQHLQDELVQDVLTTARALRDLCGTKAREQVTQQVKKPGEISAAIYGVKTVRTRLILLNGNKRTVGDFISHVMGSNHQETPLFLEITISWNDCYKTISLGLHCERNLNIFKLPFSKNVLIFYIDSVSSLCFFLFLISVNFSAVLHRS